jgi:formyltetrahydrofolate synthetase
MQHTLTQHDKKQVDMLNPLKSTLRSSFPEKDGWKLYNRYNWSSKVYDYVLQKEEGKNTLRIVVEINFGDQVSLNDFVKLNELAKRLESGTIQVVRTVMVVQENTQIEAPETTNVEMISMSELIQNGIMNLQHQLNNSKLVA